MKTVSISQSCTKRGCSCSPSVLVSPPLNIITESFLNCQIELSGGHLFNKYCLVNYNEMEKMRESFFFIRRESLKIKISIKKLLN